MTTAAPVLGKMSENYASGLTLHAGKSTVIEVPFTGAPQPSVTWKWNGQQLPDRTRTTAQTVQDATALTLNRVQRSDAGTYSVLLENGSGKATFSVKLKVIGACYKMSSICYSLQMNFISVYHPHHRRSYSQTNLPPPKDGINMGGTRGEGQLPLCLCLCPPPFSCP